MPLKLYLSTLVILIVLDLLWIGLVGKTFYMGQLGFLLKSEIKWIPIVLFYVLFAGGLVLFAVLPALEKNSWIHALSFGALLGAMSYGTYDLINFATLKDWPLSVTIVDLLWGMVLCSAVSTTSFWIGKTF